MVSIYSNIEVLRNFNINLLNEMAEQIGVWKGDSSKTPMVGKLFLEMVLLLNPFYKFFFFKSAFLKMYTQYCDNHDTAVRKIKALCSSKAEVGTYMQVCRFQV